MVKELMHDPIFLGVKSEIATKEDLQMVQIRSGVIYLIALNVKG